jgi:hypothetical protein
MQENCIYHNLIQSTSKSIDDSNRREYWRSQQIDHIHKVDYLIIEFTVNFKLSVLGLKK